MKRVFKPVKWIFPMLMFGCAFAFTACSDDDENTPVVPDEVTTEAMYGDYTGKMLTLAASSTADEGEDTPEGVDVSAKVDNDTVYLEKFPIKDIVLSIVQDETLADQIVEAVGDVNYKIGYEPTLSEAKDSISFVMEPEPLKLSLSMPSATGDAQTMVVEVKVEAVDGAGYAVESGNMKFDLSATEVLLGEGDSQISFPGFSATTFKFDMNQQKAE
ncbi:DUF4840 domain-containing protein [Phocaeicola barnesiae]|jgi:hypothetical protein|uniref:DUF4840 domain-containing protein n=1 Tax=Phocaeicola barnesiae TaxID=376804 RepID=UPI001F400BEF|nr:DUF4840 domain-containing protein [Phocaeicola barnesiae]MCF2576345.1 DUF4840 domain-containing protein [Phocaeicola barnesiae]MDM8257259.1 DUF4840 domain-containing protein [Phocaeicola barnesiae]MDM8308721.1 DUF4840 domain-containing protein [Phocaeicola barnesiae]